MNNSNKYKIEQLKMSFGTASARLKKSIMLHLLRQLKQDYCFRCNKQINFSEELSIDHKIDWLHKSPALFWDLNNIAFSHLSCNSRSGKKPSQQPHLSKYDKAPEGKAWCSGCQKYLEFNKFYKNRSRKSGYSCYCKSCIINKNKLR